MIILGIETGGGACSVALARDQVAIARSVTPMRHGHAQHLPPAIELLLKQADLTVSAIDLIGVTVGPGAFTGLRVGLAAAGGLALATGAGIVGVSSFAAVTAMCQPLTNAASRTIVIDSRREEPFMQSFDSAGQALGPGGWYRSATIIEELPRGDVHLAGDGAPALARLLDQPPNSLEATGAIDPLTVCRLAFLDRNNARTDPPPPAYLRPPDVKLPNRRPSRPRQGHSRL